MKSYEAKVLDGGRIVLPAPLRRSAGVRTGDMVTLSEQDGQIVMMTPRMALDRLRELMRPLKGEGSIVDELIADRRREAAAE